MLLIDFSDTNPQQGRQIIAQAKEFVAKQPYNSLYILTDLTGCHYDTDESNELRDLAAHNKPYAKLGAVGGVTGLKRIVGRAIIKFTGRKIELCETIEQAKDWLATQD